MAEGLFRQMVANRPDIRVRSAGISTFPGQPPSPHAVDVLADLRIDISNLRSQPLSEELVQEASCIIAMTRSHMESIQYLFPEAAEKTFLLREFEDNASSLDLSDPIGMGLEAYEVTRDIIRRALPGILKFIDSGALETKFDTDSMTMNQPGNLSLEQVDPAIFQAIKSERQRQFENIELIASENFTSRAVMEAQGSVLTNKYAEGYPGRRWYGGCEYVDVAEQLAIDRAKQLFGAEHVNVQAHSGSQANMAVYFSVLQPGDRILTMDLSHGGHLTHGNKANFSGRFYEVIHYGVNRETEQIDYDHLAKMAEETSAQDDYSGGVGLSEGDRFQKDAGNRRSWWAPGFSWILLISPVLVATGVHPTPVGIADFVTTTTHKSLRGPRGGIVMCKPQHAKSIDSMIFPGVQGGPLMHVIAAKAVCFHEALQPGFKEYQVQITLNAKALAASLHMKGYRLVSGGTDNHLMLVDLRSKGMNGKQAQEILDQAGITVNKNSIPFDTEAVFKGGGIRIGTPAVTTRGMKEEEMMEIADLIDKAFTSGGDSNVLSEVRTEVKRLTSHYPLPG